jgi:tight adherence protein B
LRLVAEQWPALTPVQAAHAVGADVPTALRAASRMPGAGDLRLLAAAWEVSGRTGQGLSAAVSRVCREVAATERTRRVVDAELAAARATAKVVAVLPLAAWVMGPAGVSGPPRFLLGQPAGWLVLALGLALGSLGLWWIEVITGRVEPGR